MLGLGFLGVAGYFLFFRDTSSNIYDKNSYSDLPPEVAQAIIADSDNDGLKDWEEILWKTKIDNNDSDGDGYSDGEESKLGYDPTDPLSNINTGKKAVKTPNSPFVPIEDDPNNLTQLLAKGMNNQVASVADFDEDILSDPMASMDENTAQNILGFTNSLKIRVSEKELKTSQDNSTSAIQNYMDAIDKAIPETPYSAMSEDDILAQAVQTNNFKKIDEFIDYYQTSITNMLNITIPSNFLKTHKRQTELMMATQEVYKNIKEVNADPLKTILALEENLKIREEMNGLIKEFVILVQKHYE